VCGRALRAGSPHAPRDGIGAKDTAFGRRPRSAQGRRVDPIGVPRRRERSRACDSTWSPLVVRAGRLAQAPHLESLGSLNNARRGFFDAADFDAVVSELPEDLRPVMRFAYCTGWRVHSEVLPLTWRDVDLDAGLVRLEPGTKKNSEGHAFPFDALPALKALLEAQRARTTAVERATDAIVP